MQDRVLYYLTPIFKFLLFVFFLIAWWVPIRLFSDLGIIDLTDDSLPSLFLNEVALCIMILGALLMTFKVLSGYNFDKICISRRNSLAGLGYGSLIGFILILVCTGLAWWHGNVVFSIGKVNISLFVYYLVLYIFVAISEELLFRSFILIIFAERYPISFSILLTSCLFGLAHIGNPDFNAMAMLNITLAGILFSVLILQRRNISWGIGIHFGWNFTQGNLLGYQVSGTDSPGLLNAKPVGPYYFSGGSFGIESSVFCTLVLVFLIIYLLVKYQIEPIGSFSGEKSNELHEFNS